MWLLNHAQEGQHPPELQHPRHYGPDVQHALFLVWHAANCICAKRLIPYLPTLVEALERHEHLHLTEECRSQLLSMSAATADRLLRSQRKGGQRGLSTTRAGTLLKQQIPIRTFEDWNETRPGFLEADLVAHCGADIEGGYLYTLTLTDVATGRTECLPLLHRSQEAVLAALQRVRTLFPFPILGIDTDNGGEFIIDTVIAYCEQEQITFTRGRPHLKNDQCFVEQKNGAMVRQVVGYDRFFGEHANRQLTELYRALRLYVNCFQPSMKLPSKQREGSKVRRTYDQAQTPMQRLLASDAVPPNKQQELLRITQALDPLRLLEQLEQLQKALFQHAVKPGAASPSQEGSSTLPFSVKLVTREQVPADGIPGTAPSLQKSERRRRYQRSGRPHDWRTRKDPFEGEWEQISSWLLANPELTGVDIFHKLEQLSPGRYRPTQVRTLQRGLGKLRGRLLVTFHDQWGEEVVNGHTPTPELRGEIVAGIC